MLDANSGRWMQQDPIGFDAEDPNLYRYVGNNSTNATDPSGKIGIFIDGYQYVEKDRTVIGTLHAVYTGPKKYYTPGAGNVLRIVNQAYDEIVAAIKENPKERVDLFGWSRGGIAAIALAGKLHQNGIKVDFLGVIDPIIPFSQVEKGDLKRLTGVGIIAPNIKMGLNAHRNVGADERDNVTLFGPGKEHLRLKNVNGDSGYPITHLETGFYGPIGEDLWFNAHFCGAPLPPYKDNPFSKKTWDPKPRGGGWERFKEALEDIVQYIN